MTLNIEVKPEARTGAQLLVDCLELHGAEIAYCVPGESYLAVLDALVDANIRLVTAKHESGAAMMAEAHGKLTGTPGLCFVTRGPGSTNASAGVHIAAQDSTPMLLFVGQVATDAREREAFQELDYKQVFGSIAKWVVEISDPARIPEIISRAYHVATSGRPGPVVLALPEDMLTERASPALGRRYAPGGAAPRPADLERLSESLARARAPLVILGGGGWNAEACENVRRFSENWSLPVAAAFRAQDYFDNRHPHYVGDVGLGINPKLAARIKSADWLLLLGTRMDEVPSGNYTYLKIPRPDQFLVHVHQDPEEIGRVYQADIGIAASVPATAEALAALPISTGVWHEGLREARREYEVHVTPGETPGPLQLGAVMTYLRDTLPEDAIITNGAGNYTVWVHRFYQYRRYRTQLAPVSGSMGYGLPAAIGAKIQHPDRTVVCFAGDGCFQMTMQEFGTAMQFGAGVIVIVVNNGMYGTIRMHQERHFPGRVSATDIHNPDFVALARAYGGHAELVTETGQFPAAFERARAAGKAALIELQIDPEALTPAMTLTQIREAALAAR
ncbi:thiamine pyrophosphate-binding protein [Sphingobium chungangianum]